MSTRDDMLTKLQQGLRAIGNDAEYFDMNIADVKRFWPYLLQENDDQFPMIIIDDNGNEPRLERAGVARIKTFLNISGVIRADDGDDLVKRNENMSAALLKYLYSEPDLGDTFLDLMPVETEDQGIYSQSSRSFASVLHRVRLLWYDTVRTVASNADTDVYGIQWIDDARDKLVARIEALKTTMATGYTPTFSYVYPRHLVPELRLNAVTIGVTDFSQEPFAGASSGVTSKYMISFTVRVHTAYEDQTADDQEVGRLINSIANKVQAQQNLGDGYRIEEISGIVTESEFSESESRGGEFTVTIGKAVLHAQE